MTRRSLPSHLSGLSSVQSVQLVGVGTHMEPDCDPPGGHQVGPTVRGAGSIDLATNDRRYENSRLVIFDVDDVVLPRPALLSVLSVLARSGSIGPVRFLVERFKERRHRRRARRAEPLPERLSRRPDGGAMASQSSARYVLKVAPGDFARLVNELAADLREVADVAMRRAIGAHVSAGDFVVLHTAAPQEFAEALACELGAHRACGTRLSVDKGRYTGAISAQARTDQHLRELLGADQSQPVVRYGRVSRSARDNVTALSEPSPFLGRRAPRDDSLRSL